MPTDAETQWGTATIETGGDVYLYGTVTSATGTFTGMKLARVPQGSSLDVGAWRYWDGAAWVQGESGAVVIPTSSALTGVARQPGTSGYVATSIAPSVFSDTVDVSFATSLTGPWTAPRAVYHIPEIGQYHDEIAYIPTVHPELSWGNVLVVSYNVNTTDGLGALLQDVHGYQPRFIDVSG